MNGAPGKIFAPIDDAAGMEEIRDVVVVPGPEIHDTGHIARGIAKGPLHLGGAEEGEEELSRLLQNALGPLICE